MDSSDLENQTKGLMVMLRALSIRNVLLIDHLDLAFETGLGVLTGETGAGKSILLDAMGLALGERASPGLIRQGSSQAVVTAEFDLPAQSPLFQTLQELDLKIEGSDLLLRRVLTSDGKSRAFVNDQSISLNFLKRLGESLVEIHGQFDQLLNSSTHRRYLDHFGQLKDEVTAVSDLYHSLQNAKAQVLQARADLANRKARALFIEQSLAELEAAHLTEDEEQDLLKEKDYLKHHAKIVEAAQEAADLLGGDKGAEMVVTQAQRFLERVCDVAPDLFIEALETLNRAAIELQEVSGILASYLRRSTQETRSLEAIEDRLYTLRSLARKHVCTPAALLSLRDTLRAEKDKLDQGSDYIKKCEQQLDQARQAFVTRAEHLSQQRHQVALVLERTVHQELIPLKLDKASLKVVFQRLTEDQWSATGIDRLEFNVQTNPGMPFGSFAKIASGGERARFMLALKVILAQESCVSLLIFDEIDTGVGGAVASAIGERLSRLGQHLQLLTVTHSPQVASYANFHWRVMKKMFEHQTVTTVVSLTVSEREEEVARMLAGESITLEARAAARQLLSVGQKRLNASV